MAHGYDLYAGADEDAGLRLLDAAEHGHLAVWDGEAQRPAITFLHYAPRTAQREIWGHIANTNPLLPRLEADPRATFTVFGPTAYVPSYYSGEPRGVPTSYYSWGQFEVEVELVRDPTGLLAILAAMLARYQPEGRHPAMDPTERYWQGMLGAITGVILRIRAGASRFKYGQNKPARTRQAIAEALERRGLGQDAAAAEQVRAHLPADPAAESPSA
jgi:predicted FMN-binding regulatory protein PaiB